jgi:hypothetical protein
LMTDITGGGLAEDSPLPPLVFRRWVQGLVPQRVVGVEECEQLGRGDGPGARTCAARSDRGRRRSRPVAGEVGGQPWRVV